MNIYLLTNKVNGKYYVGKTVQSNVKRYLSSKKWAATLPKDDPRGEAYMPIVRAIRKYGFENFIVEVLAETDNHEKLCALEKLWIVLLDARNTSIGYNICAGGKGTTGRKNSEETLVKMRKAAEGRVPPPYTRTEKHRQQSRENMLKNIVEKGLQKSFTSGTCSEYITNETLEQKEKRACSMRENWKSKTLEQKKKRIAPMRAALGRQV
jgi:group I intron endonuclease